MNSKIEFMDIPIPLIKEDHVDGHPTHKNTVPTELKTMLSNALK